MIYNERSLPSDVEDFEKRLSEFSTEDLDKINAEIAAYQDRVEKQKTEIVTEQGVEYVDTVSMIDPFLDTEHEDISPLSEYPEGMEFGMISIPKIGENLPLYLGASQYNLSLGAAHVEGSDLPMGGKGTRSVISGHRGYYSRPMFLHLDKLTGYDRIYIYSPVGYLVYEVKDMEEIYPNQTRALDPREGKDFITLLTCTPYPTNLRRLLVNAERVEGEGGIYYTKEKGITKEVLEERPAIESLVQEEQGQVDPEVSRNKTIIYTVAIAGSILFVFVLVKWVQALKKLIKGDGHEEV